MAYWQKLWLINLIYLLKIIFFMYMYSCFPSNLNKLENYYRCISGGSSFMRIKQDQKLDWWLKWRPNLVSTLRSYKLNQTLHHQFVSIDISKLKKKFNLIYYWQCTAYTKSDKMWLTPGFFGPSPSQSNLLWWLQHAFLLYIVTTSSC